MIANWPICPKCQGNQWVYRHELNGYYWCSPCSIWFTAAAPDGGPTASVSLRDRIMLAALPALIMLDSKRPNGRKLPDELTRSAYAFADEALAVRNEPKETA